MGRKTRPDRSPKRSLSLSTRATVVTKPSHGLSPTEGWLWSGSTSIRQTVGIGGDLIIEEFLTFAMPSPQQGVEPRRHYITRRQYMAQPYRWMDENLNTLFR